MSKELLFCIGCAKEIKVMGKSLEAKRLDAREKGFTISVNTGRWICVKCSDEEQGFDPDPYTIYD